MQHECHILRKGVIASNQNIVAAQAAVTPADILDDASLSIYLGGIEPRTLRLWRRNRGLPHVKLTSKFIRYRKADIDRWLDSHRVAIVG
jgi:hypothetical protein